MPKDGTCSDCTRACPHGRGPLSHGASCPIGCTLVPGDDLPVRADRRATRGADPQDRHPRGGAPLRHLGPAWRSSAGRRIAAGGRAGDESATVPGAARRADSLALSQSLGPGLRPAPGLARLRGARDHERGLRRHARTGGRSDGSRRCPLPQRRHRRRHRSPGVGRPRERVRPCSARRGRDGPARSGHGPGGCSIEDFTGRRDDPIYDLAGFERVAARRRRHTRARCASS